MNTFHFKIDNGPEKTVETESGLYTVGAAAALAHVDSDSIYPGDGVLIEIWVPELLPDYGPYFYRAKFDEYQNIVVSQVVFKAT